MSLILLGLGLVLAIIVYEDFRYRGVHWFLFPILWALAFYLGFSRLETVLAYRFVLFNAAFLLLHFIVLSLYFSLKEKRLINLFQHYLGLGDALFVIALLPLFNPLALQKFIIVVAFVSLVLFLVLRQAVLPTLRTVPLAGCMALALLLLIGLEQLLGISWRY